MKGEQKLKLKVQRKKIELLRAEKGLTTAQIVKDAKVTHKTLMASEMGALSLGRIAKVLGVSPEVLVLDTQIEGGKDDVK